MEDFRRGIKVAAGSGDFVELRVDCLDLTQLGERFQKVEVRLSEVGKPTILTFRPVEQGGKQQLDAHVRLRFWQFNHGAGASFCDIEFDLASDESLSSLNWSKVICSHHDFHGLPNDLDQIYDRLANTKARILKIAVQADDVTDCLPVFRLLDRAREDKRELIAIAMGTAGIPTRVLGPSRGSFLTYATADDGKGTASGQLTASELRQVYRIDNIDRQTQIMGLMGHHVSHSISPQIHNTALASANVNGVYLPFEVRDAAAFLRRMVHPRTREIDWNIRGLSVTAPHKLRVMEHLDWIEPAAKEIGAVNTIVVEDDALHGYNTDASGFLGPLTARIAELKGLRCAVIGSGGAARAVVWSLMRQGAKVTVFVRDTSKANVLASKLGAEVGPLGGAQFGGFDVVVNATPLGSLSSLSSLAAGEDQTAATSDQLRGARLAYDLVYNPTETQFLREAAAAGCETLGGLLMLLAQAADQFELWTGRAAPAEVMNEAATRALETKSAS